MNITSIFYGKKSGMDYIVFDMEWNQPAYAGGRKKIHGRCLTGEIIQIGAVKLDGNWDVCDSFSVNIEPVFYKRMNRNVRDITGITADELRGCKHFCDAYADFAGFCGTDYALVTWGRDDIPMLRDNMYVNGIDENALPEHYDLQLIFNSQITGSSRQWSLEKAMTLLKIEQKYQSHNAFFDAVNTAKIALRLDMDAGIRDYGAITRLCSFGARKEVYSGFKTMRDAFEDERASRIECPLCKTALEKNEWVEKRGKRITLSRCPQHGMLKFMLSAYNSENCFSVARRVSQASDEMIASYDSRLAAVK